MTCRTRSTCTRSAQLHITQQTCWGTVDGKNLAWALADHHVHSANTPSHRTHHQPPGAPQPSMLGHIPAGLRSCKIFSIRRGVSCPPAASNIKDWGMKGAARHGPVALTSMPACHARFFPSTVGCYNFMWLQLGSRTRTRTRQTPRCTRAHNQQHTAPSPCKVFSHSEEVPYQH